MTTTDDRLLMDRLLPLAEVSARTGVPVNTLRYWRTHGTGPRSFRVGPRVMYSEPDVEAFIRSCRES
jgi:DNA-binding transcriptional MerR regulator